MKIFSKLKSLLVKKPVEEVLRADKYGVTVEKDGIKTQLLRWKEVSRIAVYKKDELMTDLICIEFGLGENMIVTIHEEIEGYDSIVQNMEKEFKGIEEDWYSKIVKPAFERNYRVIYETEGSGT